jgi:hypothetical protein
VAILTEFDANFDKFKSAVGSATLTLKSFTTDTDKVNTSLSRMTDSFSGAKVIQQATLMTEAIARVGGVGELTDKVLQQIAPTIQEAIDKMKKLGLEVPADLQKVADATKGVSSGMSTIGRLASELAGPLVALFSVQQVIAFGKDVLAAGDAIQKMADQTGLATDAVQELQYIAGQTGSGVETLVSAAQNLQAKLGAGDAGTIGAIRRLNINLEDFQQLNTEQQLYALSDAIRAIKDPTEQAAKAADVFGKNWKEILPAMKSDMRALGEEAPKMSQAAVEALDAIGDSMTGAYQAAVALGGEGVLHVTNFLKAIYDFQSRFDLSHLGSSVTEMLAPLEMTKKAIEDIGPPQLAMVAGFQQIKLSVEEIAAIEKLSDADQAARAVQQKKDSDAKIAMKKAEEQAARDLAAAERAYWDGVADLMEKATGKAAIDAASKWKDAIDQLGGDLSRFSNKDLADLQDAMNAAIAAMVRNGQATDALSSEFAALMIKAQGVTQGIKEVAAAAAGASGTVTDFTQKLYDEARAADAARNAAAGLTGQTGGTTATSGYSVDTSNPSAGAAGTGAGASYYLPPRRAAGGPVAAGTSYLVGERGPELFTPSANGSISPNGAGVVVNNVFHLVDTESNLARRVSDLIARSVLQARRV